jgi:anti-sigma B factor antagonist
MDGRGGLEISVDEPSEGVVVVAPTGELDMSNGDLLEEAIERARRDGVANLIIDLRALSFMDSSGLRLLLDAWNESKLADRRLSIVVAKTGLVRRVLEVSGCDVVLPVVADLDAAL